MNDGLTKIVFQYEEKIGNQYNIIKGEMLSKIRRKLKKHLCH